MSLTLASLHHCASIPLPPLVKLVLPVSCDVAASNTCVPYGGFLMQFQRNLGAGGATSNQPTCKNLTAFNPDDALKTHHEPYKCLVMLADLYNNDFWWIRLFDDLDCKGKTTLFEMGAVDTAGGKSPVTKMGGDRLTKSVRFSREKCTEVLQGEHP